MKAAAAADAVLSRPAPAASAVTARAPRRIGVSRTPWWSEGGADMHYAFETSVALFGAQIETDDVDLDDFAASADLHRTIMAFEAAQSLAWEASSAPDALSGPMARSAR